MTVPTGLEPIIIAYYPIISNLLLLFPPSLAGYANNEDTMSPTHAGEQVNQFFEGVAPRVWLEGFKDLTHRLTQIVQAQKDGSLPANIFAERLLPESDQELGADRMRVCRTSPEEQVVTVEVFPAVPGKHARLVVSYRVSAGTSLDEDGPSTLRPVEKMTKLVFERRAAQGLLKSRTHLVLLSAHEVLTLQSHLANGRVVQEERAYSLPSSQAALDRFSLILQALSIRDEV